MRIGISFLGINRHMGGNFQYAINMLQDLAGVSNGHELVVFYDNDLLMQEGEFNVSVASYVKVDIEGQNKARAMARMGVGLGFLKSIPSWVRGRYVALDNCGCEVIFHPYWGTGAFITKTPSIAAIHDCAPREAPAIMPWRSRTGLDILIRSIVRNASFILADSQHGRNLLAKYYIADTERVVVHPFRPPQYLFSEFACNSNEVLAKYNIESGYLFLPGRWGSYKNTERVLEAMRLIAERGLLPPTLVLCGIKKDEIPLANKEVIRRNLQDSVHVLGFVPDEDMPSLYHNALALVFPTLLGPTSIPVYEAMALGCPVIVSNISGYPEQVGDAGILVDPYSVESIADGILQIVSDTQLREELKEKGKWQIDATRNVDHGNLLLELATQAAGRKSK